MKQPLNMFQRLIREWERVHPYNAAQVVTLRELADASAIEKAWGATLSTLRLGRLRTSGGAYDYQPVDRSRVNVLSTSANLCDYLSGEMNRPFDDSDEPPFRPFAAVFDEGLRLGVVYRHWVADSVSIRAVMSAWIAKIFQPGVVASPLRRVAPGYLRLFGRALVKPDADLTGFRVLRDYLRLRSAAKLPTTGVGDYAVRVATTDATRGLIDPLQAAVRGVNATVGDALLASLAHACDRFLPVQHRPRRRNLALASVVDLRRHAGEDLSDVFGLYLGFTHVIAKRGDMEDVGQLLASVSRQNRDLRRHHIGAKVSLSWMMAALASRQLKRGHDLYRFYRKQFPLCAGLSNVNLGEGWSSTGRPATPEPSSYLRVSPTGPLAPLALSATTLDGQMTLALTYRPALLEDDAAGELLRQVVRNLTRLAQSAPNCSLAIDQQLRAG